MLRETILVFAALILFANATIVNHCDSDVPFEDANQISISGCDKPECSLKQGTTITIEMKLVPNRDIQSVTNNVNGILASVPLPFVGVDGTNACDNIYDADGKAVGCPLKKGEQYMYKNSFPILSIYPRGLYFPLASDYMLEAKDSKLLSLQAASYCCSTFAAWAAFGNITRVPLSIVLLFFNIG